MINFNDLFNVILKYVEWDDILVIMKPDLKLTTKFKFNGEIILIIKSALNMI